MSNGILIQAGCLGHEQLLALTDKRHRLYCERHRLDFHSSTEHPVAWRNPAWEKVRLILDALRFGYEYVIWLDADCLIARMEVDVRDACTGAVGMVYFGKEYADPPHYNSGAIYIRNHPGVREFFEAVWIDWPVNHPWEDQVAINRQAKQLNAEITTLDFQWNCTPNLPCPAPVVLAWHGHSLEVRERVMADAAGRL